jgi:hypothetical protein
MAGEATATPADLIYADGHQSARPSLATQRVSLALDQLQLASRYAMHLTSYTLYVVLHSAA